MAGTVDRPGLVAANVVAFVVWGVALSFWMLRYTDWFPVVGGLLGLGGAFTWVAFFSNIVPAARKQAFQDWFDRHVLQRPWPIGSMSLLSLAFLLLYTSWHGTLVVDTLGDSVPRTATLTRLDGGAASRFGTAARAERTVLLATAPLRATPYRLKLSGLPSFRVEVAPWRRRTVVIPGDALTAPVVLLRPTATMSGEASSGEFALLVHADGQEYGRLMDYRGEAVWIGAEGDVEVPPAAIERWRMELIVRDLPTALVQRWTTPRPLLGARPLEAGLEITAAILRRPDAWGTPAAGVQGEASVTLKTLVRGSDFPQEMVIDVD